MGQNHRVAPAKGLYLATRREGSLSEEEPHNLEGSRMFPFHLESFSLQSTLLQAASMAHIEIELPFDLA